MAAGGAGLQIRVSAAAAIAHLCVSLLMAWNQATFFFYPPGYSPAVERSPTAKHVSGEPLRIVSTNMTDSNAPKVLTKHLRQWFVDRGLSEKERYGDIQVLFRGLHTAPTRPGTESLIDLVLPLGKDQIEVLRIRFLLTERTPDQIPEWRELIAELGYDFEFQIMGPDDRLLPCTDFVTLLTTNHNFCAAEKDYGWKI
jgi:hypothetical protein